MKKGWQWALCLGSCWWIGSVMGLLGVPLEWLIGNVVNLSEVVALSIGVIYSISENARLAKLPWKIVWAEVGMFAMVVYGVWALLLGGTTILLDEGNRNVLFEISGSLDSLWAGEGLDWEELLWVPKFLVQMIITMGIPVGIIKWVLGYIGKNKTEVV